MFNLPPFQIIPVIQHHSIHNNDTGDNGVDNECDDLIYLFCNNFQDKQIATFLPGASAATAAAQPAGAAAAADYALPTVDGNVGRVRRSEATAEEQWRWQQRRWN